MRENKGIAAVSARSTTTPPLLLISKSADGRGDDGESGGWKQAEKWLQRPRLSLDDIWWNEKEDIRKRNKAGFPA